MKNKRNGTLYGKKESSTVEGEALNAELQRIVKTAVEFPQIAEAYSQELHSMWSLDAHEGMLYA